MEEGLKHVSCFGDSYDTGSPGVIDPVMEVINAAGVHNLLPGDVRAGELANTVPELRHGSVVLGPPKQAHVRIGQVLWHRQRFAIRPNKGACNCQTKSLACAVSMVFMQDLYTGHKNKSEIPFC